jgi:ribosomal protein S3
LDDKFNLELKKFYISAFFIKNLLKFNYFKYIWSQIKKINLRNARGNNVARYRSILVGFKLAFKGRFSRKQRASDIWYMRGKVPLNTLSIKLDYFFFTIPIKNSAISIKIILYKNSYIEKFKRSLSF